MRFSVLFYERAVLLCVCFYTFVFSFLSVPSIHMRDITNCLSVRDFKGLLTICALSHYVSVVFRALAVRRIIKTKAKKNSSDVITPKKLRTILSDAEVIQTDLLCVCVVSLATFETCQHRHFSFWLLLSFQLRLYSRSTVTFTCKFVICRI